MEFQSYSFSFTCAVPNANEQVLDGPDLCGRSMTSFLELRKAEEQSSAEVSWD